MATLGPTSTGGVTGGGLGSGIMWVSQFTMPAGGGTVTSLNALVNGAAATAIYPVVYADSAGAPGALLRYGSNVTVPTSGYAFLNLPLSSGILVAAGVFWFGYAIDSGTVSYD